MKNFNDNNLCSLCGAKLNARWENIKKGQITTLAIFRDAIIKKNRNSIHLQKDIKFTNSQFTNFQKLRYNGLVAHASDTGNWLLTRRGAQFLRNEIFIPKGVLIFRNKIQKYHIDKVNLLSILKNNEPYWFDIEDYELGFIDTIDYEMDGYDWIQFDAKGQGFLKF